MRRFGYVRVSTREQNPERQIEELKKYVPDERDILIDKISGSKKERPELEILKRFVRSRDEVYIHELDRLGRNKQNIKEELEYFHKKGVVVRILDVPTTLINFENYGDVGKSLMEMINNLLIEVFSTLAEAELEKNKKRREEGIKNAKEKGVKFGRPKKRLPGTFYPVYKDWINKKITAAGAARFLNISRGTFYNWVKIKEKENGKTRNQA